ncbi:hypothetical protein PTKIN_Ptkin11bG0190100 [Pterospermum kingtungense]
MAGEPSGMTCVLQLETDSPGWHKTMFKLFNSIQDVTYSIDTQAKVAHVSGKIEIGLMLKLLAKSSEHVLTHQINYGIHLPKPISKPMMKCVLLVDTDIPGWHKSMCPLFESIEDVRLNINADTKIANISGKISPELQFKLLAKAEAEAARLCWLQYGYEHDPYGGHVHKELSESNETSSSKPAPKPKPKNSFCCLM